MKLVLGIYGRNDDALQRFDFMHAVQSDAPD